MPNGPYIPTDPQADTTRYALRYQLSSGKWQEISRAMVASGQYTRTSDGVVLAMQAPIGQWLPIEDTAFDLSLNYECYTVLAATGVGAVALTLPDAADYPGAVFVIKKTDDSANAITITPTSTALIDGAATLVLRRENDAVMLQCDGVNWWVLARAQTFDAILTDANGDVLSDANGDVLTE